MVPGSGQWVPTNGDGVGICEWNDATMLDYHNSYKRIIYRHLRFTRTSTAIERLQTFLKVNMY